MTSSRSVVLAAPVRTAIGTFGGSLKEVPASDLGAAAIGASVARAGLVPATGGDSSMRTIWKTVLLVTLCVTSAYGQTDLTEQQRIAVGALIEEAELTPKPALVDRRGPGAHADLSLRLMRCSAHALRSGFELMALASFRQIPGRTLREDLGTIGRRAERSMLLTTGGVNTHRGAIWTLSLRSTVIEESGLIGALQMLVERSNVAGRLRCNFRSNCIPEETLPVRVQHELLRIAQEAISNAIRHGKPTVVTVTLRWEAPNLILQIKDNGSGIPKTRRQKSETIGLRSMRERAARSAQN